MIFRPLELEGAWLIEPEPFEDERGTFARTFCRREFAEHGLCTDYPQGNVSTNRSAGTLRGIHFQLPPHEEAKLVRCSRGRLFDAIVDLRPDSATLGRSLGVELSSADGHQLYVPEGFGHGFLTLEEDTEVTYLMSESFVPDSGAGYCWDDPAFAIRWPQRPEVISEKDRELPLFDRERHQRRMREAVGA